MPTTNSFLLKVGGILNVAYIEGVLSCRTNGIVALEIKGNVVRVFFDSLKRMAQPLAGVKMTKKMKIPGTAVTILHSETSKAGYEITLSLFTTQKRSIFLNLRHSLHTKKPLQTAATVVAYEINNEVTDYELSDFLLLLLLNSSN